MGVTAVAASPGGIALLIDSPIDFLDNTNGIIAGGGGGGGGSAELGGSNNNNAPGGGGAGIPGGRGGDVTWRPGYTYYPAAGGEVTGGTSGYNATVGKGGDRGKAGNGGGAVGSTTNYYFAGAAPGYAIYGLSNIVSSLGLTAAKLIGPSV